MNIAIVGTGYVGLVSGTCFAEMGTTVYCVDIDSAKIEGLKNGVIPIYEPGLQELVLKNVRAQRLHFSTSLAEVLPSVDIVFSAVGTPPDEDGSADLQYVLDVARTFGKHIEKYTLLVTKSTVPVGTAQKVKAVIEDELRKRGKAIEFDIASNPEFLKEGAAIKDFLTPDRVVIGVESKRAEDLMRRLYRPFTLNNYPVIFMDIPSAEMSKYAANAMLATRISFMNEIANLCEVLGADISNVRKGIAADKRIGGSFLYAGCGYGGSCFPKDVKALLHTAKENGMPLRVVEAVEAANEHQKQVLVGKLEKIYGGDLRGKKVALWGLSFKPETDDMREAPALRVVEDLLARGCVISAYDPIAITEARRRFGDKIEYAETPYAAVENADALILLTEWKEFRLPDWKRISALMKQKLVLDGRNIYDAAELKDLGFEYYGIGR